MKRLAFCALLPLLAGCGGYYSVKVPRRLPDSPAIGAARPALGAMYLVVRPPARPAAAEGGGAAALLGQAGPDMNFQLLARRTAKALAGPEARVCAWSVERAGGERERFAPRLKPSGVLALSLREPSVSARKEERAAVQYDKKKQKQTVKSKVWAYTASLAAEAHLLAYPGGEVLDTWADVFTFSEDRFDNARSGGEWYEGIEEKLFAAAAAKASARYAGREVERFRPVFALKKDKLSEKAAGLAWKGRWKEAAAIWRGRLETPAGGWRDHLGLAVEAELAGAYSEAAAHYGRAREASAGDKKAKGIRWAEIFRDLDYALKAPPPAECDRSWFEVKTAVLPFSDETTSVDGPPLARELLFAQLKAAGYSLVPLERTDEILRSRGFSDGGQLGAAKPADLARWLGAGRLLYCNLTDYGEIMAGVYNRRMVSGEVRVWEEGGGEFSFEESAVKVKTGKNFLGGLAGQLAKGLTERLRNKPLAYEAGVFSRQAAERLPAMK